MRFIIALEDIHHLGINLMKGELQPLQEKSETLRKTQTMESYAKFTEGKIWFSPN